MTNKTLAMEMVEALERVCSPPPEGIGRTPTRDEFQRHSKYARSQIDTVFGSYVEFLLAAGRHSKNRTKKIDKQEIREKVFEKLKEEVAEKKSATYPPKLYERIFVWGDRHLPYQHPDAISFLIAIKDKYNPDLVIDIGDGEDYHALSFHDSNVDLLSAGHELSEVIKINKALYSEFPRVWAVDSNHSSMAFRKGLHHGFPRHIIKSYRDVLEAPIGWEWFSDIVVQMSNGKKCLFHHSLGGNVLLASQKRGMSLVQGHHHSKFSIQWWSNSEGTYFAAQTGCLVDDTSMAFAYNKASVERPIMGSLIIINGIPHLLPMILDSSGRWTKNVP